MIKIKIKKGNTVKILSGNDKGKSGEVIKLFPKNFSAIVKGMNLKKKHQKPTKKKGRNNNYGETYKYFQSDTSE